MKLTTRPAPPAPLSFRTSLSARLFLSFIGLTLAAAGVAFTMLLWRAYQRASETYTWRELPCVIRKSVVEETRENLSEPVQYVPSILYNYLLEEVSHESSHIRRVPGQTFKERAGAEAIVTKYPAGQGSLCYVNPENPDESILMRETRASLYTIWFPLLFVVGGLGMVINVWWPQPGGDVDEP